MNKAIDEVISTLRTLLAADDDAFRDGQVQRAKQLFANWSSTKENLRPKRREMNEYAYYDLLFLAAGGKMMHRLFSDYGGGPTMEQKIRKMAEATLDARYAKIGAKMVKAGVTHIGGAQSCRNEQGFQGTWFVDTDSGKKIITIDVILAGGYNIKCLHTRTLVKVK